MKNLYVISLEAYSGKSASCLGMAINYRNQGLKVAYMKPVGTLVVRVDQERTDEDAVFICRAMTCTYPLTDASPVILTTELARRPLKGPVSGLDQVVSSALNRLRQDNDLVILEGPADLAQGLSIGLSPRQVADLTDSQVVLVTRYRRDLSLDHILLAQSLLGERFVGVIVNSMPQDRDERDLRKKELSQFLDRSGLRLLGGVPEDKLLASITISDLAELLEGEIISCDEKCADLVEGFVIGAMSVDSALRSFQRIKNKAVIVEGDRSDIIMAALQTPTKCLILTGNLIPNRTVLARAVELGIPAIVVAQDTMTTVNVVEKVMGRIRLSSPTQINRLVELFKENVDLDGILGLLGS